MPRLHLHIAITPLDWVNLPENQGNHVDNSKVLWDNKNNMQLIMTMSAETWFFSSKWNLRDQAIKTQPHINSSETHHLRRATKIAMLGSFPPLRGLSSYCLELSLALADRVQVYFISFKRTLASHRHVGYDSSGTCKELGIYYFNVRYSIQLWD